MEQEYSILQYYDLYRLKFELLRAIFIKLQNTRGSINFMLNLKLIIVCCYSYLMNILTIS